MTLEYKILITVGYVVMFFLGYQLGRLVQAWRDWEKFRDMRK